MSISVRGCLYGVKESAPCFTKKNEDKTRGSVMTSTLSAKIYCVVMTPSSKGGKNFVCMAGILDQNGLAVSGAVVGEKVMPVKADLKVVSEVQKLTFMILILEKSRTSTGCLYHLSTYPR